MVSFGPHMTLLGTGGCKGQFVHHGYSCPSCVKMVNMGAGSSQNDLTKWICREPHSKQCYNALYNYLGDFHFCGVLYKSVLEFRGLSVWLQGPACVSVGPCACLCMTWVPFFLCACACLCESCMCWHVTGTCWHLLPSGLCDIITKSKSSES